MADSNGGIRVEPAAAIAAAGVVFIGFMMWNKRSKKCKDFPNLWVEDAPLHISNDDYVMAMNFATTRLQQAKTEGVTVNLKDLQLEIANQLAGDCNWPDDSLHTMRGKELWESFLKIAEAAHEKVYGTKPNALDEAEQAKG